MTVNRRRAPDGLQKPGKRMWSAILTEFDLDERELLVLEQACRQADNVAALEAEIAASGLVTPGSKGQMRLSPTVTELRQARLAVSRLLTDLALPDQDDQSEPSRRGRKAAEARWKGTV